MIMMMILTTVMGTSTSALIHRLSGGFLNRAVGKNQGEACDEEHGEGKSHLSPMDFPMIKRRMRKMDWHPCSPLAMSMSQKRRNLRISVVLQSGGKGH